MATQNHTESEFETFTARVPRSMLTGPNCIAIPAGNDYRQGRHDYRVGDLLLVDLDAVPKCDDYVVVLADPPFGRVCYIAPPEFVSREQMGMGVLDADGDTVHLIQLGKNGRKFGVVVGVVPVASTNPEVQS